MSDKNNNADTNENQGTDDQNQSGSGIDEALFEELDGRVSKMTDRAAQMGFNSIEQYQDWLEQEAYKNIENGNNSQEQTTQQQSQQNQQRQNQQQNQSQQNQNSQQSNADLSNFNEKFDTIGKGVSHAVLEAQFSTYSILQLTTEEEKRSPNTKSDMANLIHGPKGVLVQSLAQDFDGNLWQAANYLLNVESGTEKAYKRGMQSQAALDKAKNTGLQSGSGIQSQQKPTTKPDHAQQLADAIAPKRGGYTEPAS